MSPASGRQALVSIAKVAVSVGLLALLFSRVDAAALWAEARQASPGWLAVSLGIYVGSLVISAWRWGVLLDAAGIALRLRRLVASFMVATFFNNFLPSNIGGDVVRVADTARPAGSKTVAALIVLADRGIGLLGLIAVAALGASLAERLPGTGIVGPSVLWLALAAGVGGGAFLLSRPALLPRLLRPFGRLHPEWVGERLDRLEGLLQRIQAAPGALVRCFGAAMAMQMVLVAFYLAIARGLAVPIGFWQLSLIVPMTFLVQMLPVSLNGFGVREATFAYYFTRMGLSLEQALVVSITGAAMILVVSLSGAATYLARNRRPVDTLA